MKVVADFHNHSCLSPCSSLEMGPEILVTQAKEKGIGLLGLCDHNSARNTPAFEAIAKRKGIFPLCGIEVTTVEEIHVLCFFETAKIALKFGELIEDTLAKIPLNRETMGDQVVVNQNEEVLEELDFYLGVASRWDIGEVERQCHHLGGLFIAAHMDRPSNSLRSQLGYVPDLFFDAFEIMYSPGDLNPGGKALIRGSDAHHPDAIGQRTCEINLEELSWSGLKQFFSRDHTKPS